MGSLAPLVDFVAIYDLRASKAIVSGELSQSHIRNKGLIDTYLTPNGMEVVFAFDRVAHVKPRRVLDPIFSPLVPNLDLTSAYGLVQDFGIEAQYRAVAKYGAVKRVTFVASDFQQEYQHIYECIGGSCRVSPWGLDEVWDSLDHSKSVGLPCNVKYSTKQEWWDAVGPSDLRDYAMWLGSLPPCTYVELWLSFLKEELLKLPKLLSGNIRQIQCLDVRALMWEARYRSPWNKRMMELRGKGLHPIMVGQPIQYGGWHEMMTLLSQFPHFYDGDISLMDTVVDHTQFYWQDWLRSQCFVPGSMKAIDWHILGLLTWNSEHRVTVLSDGNVVLVDGGNGSGHVDTTWKNSVTLWSWFLRFWRSLGLPLSQFRDHVYLIIFGDNYAYSCSGFARDSGFTGHNFGKWLKDHGIGHTGDARDNICDVEFLSYTSRNFRGYLVPYPKRIGKSWASIAYPPKKALHDVVLRLTRLLAIRNNFFADAWDNISVFRMLDKLVDLCVDVARAEGRERDPEFLNVLRMRFSASYLLAMHLPIEPVVATQN